MESRLARSAIDADRDQWESVYLEHFDSLVALSVRKFNLPESDAEVVVQEVLMSYVASAATIRDLRSWLIGATSNASRKYWRTAGRDVPLETGDDEPCDPRCVITSTEARIAAGQCLSRIEGKYREALRLRYLEGCSMEEIAEKLETTAGYVRKLIRIGIQRVQEQ